VAISSVILERRMDGNDRKPKPKLQVSGFTDSTSAARSEKMSRGIWEKRPFRIEPATDIASELIPHKVEMRLTLRFVVRLADALRLKLVARLQALLFVSVASQGHGTQFVRATR
jgi:hypothetical protein